MPVYLLFSLDSEHIPAKGTPAPGCEYPLICGLDCLRFRAVLIKVDQEIRLHQDAVIESADIGIGMVMPYQPNNARGDSFRKTQGAQQSFRKGRAVGFLKLASFGVDPFQSFMAGLNAFIPVSFGTLHISVSICLLLFMLVHRKISS